MGREVACTAKCGRDAGAGRALLETDELIFRGAFKVRVPLGEVTAVAARAGTLSVRWPGGTLALALGDAAPKWAEAIAHPKGRLDKLGVRAGLNVALAGVRDAEFRAELARALGAPPRARVGNGCDLVFLGVEKPAALARLATLREAVRPAGGIWAIYPRGQREVSEDAIRAAAKAAGLTDIKIMRFSETHGAVKLVIPKSAR